MFQPNPYPEFMPRPRKLSAFEDQAHHLGLSHRLYCPPLTTKFESGVNSAGVEMELSTGSGNECTGINDGSKNSVLTTYLADAWTWGAEMFCSIDVKYLKKNQDGSGYVIYYEVFDDHLKKKRQMWVRAVRAHL